MFEYEGWTVDPTPDYAVGKYFAHVRVVRIQDAAHGEPEMHIERNIAWFETQYEAVQAARNWALQWIRDRNDSRAGDPEARAFESTRRLRRPPSDGCIRRHHA